MKKVYALLLALCLLLGAVSVAAADGAPKFKKLLTTQTTDKKGTVSFSFRAVDFNSGLSSWHFVNPETGEDRTGPELRKFFSDVKGFSLSASNNKQVVTLKKVPDSMHGWLVYVVLSNKNGYTVTSDKVQLLCYSVIHAQDEPATAENGGTAAESITISAERLSVMPLDPEGNPTADQPVSVLTAAAPATVLIESGKPVEYWTINGIRFQPTESVNSFILGNITSDLTVTACFAGETAETADPVPAVPETCDSDPADSDPADSDVADSDASDPEPSDPDPADSDAP